jgi:5,6,7,8-tetrahydromethanopterin hydro-lyase
VISIGESFVGEGAEAAHLNTVLGMREGPIGTAWATALATPREGHAAFVVVAQPNLPVKPMTLFVNKAMIASEAHATLTWGAAQLGVASGVLDAVAGGVIPPGLLDDGLLITAVWVSPAAVDADMVYVNNRQATAEALANGMAKQPSIEELLAVRDTPINGYYVPATLREGDR